MQQSLPRISIIVATRNRLSALRRCVESIRAQHYPGELMELIIVDDSSTDETPAYLAALAAQQPWVKAVTQARGWQARARNQAIALSSGELIAVTDDDCTVAEDWLLAIASAMQDRTISAIGGRVHAPGESLVARYLDYVRALDPMLLPQGIPRYLVTANACFRREALEQVGLFDEAFAAVGGEDSELSWRMRRQGMKLRFAPTCHVSHWYSPDIRAFLRRYYHYGDGSRQIFETHLAWEHWLSYADKRLLTLLNSTPKWREFYELADAELRPWFMLLHTLQNLSYLAGYLRLTQSAQLAMLRPAEGGGKRDVAHAETATPQMELAAEIWDLLSTDLTSTEGESDLAGWLAQNSPAAPAAVLKALDLDLLLSMAIPDYVSPAPQCTVDDALPENLRDAYGAHERHLWRAYTRLYRDLRRQLVHQPDGLDLASIERACYERTLDVNGFLTWYGRYPERCKPRI